MWKIWNAWLIRQNIYGWYRVLVEKGRVTCRLNQNIMADIDYRQKVGEMLWNWLRHFSQDGAFT